MKIIVLLQLVKLFIKNIIFVGLNNSKSIDIKHYIEINELKKLKNKTKENEEVNLIDNLKNNNNLINDFIHNESLENKIEEKKDNEINDNSNEDIKNNEEEDRDPDEDLFQDDNNKKNNEKENNEQENDEKLSPLQEENDDIEDEYNDVLISQYEKVHRIKNKWKVVFKDVIMKCNGKEILLDKICGELERDW